VRACALQHGSSWDKRTPLYWIRLEEDSSLDLELFKRQKNKSV
jgi:hypothetical protein